MIETPEGHSGARLVGAASGQEKGKEVEREQTARALEEAKTKD